LASRTPVFAAMFSHEMVEAKEGIVKIEDIKAPVLEQLLHFMWENSFG
jgi:speckle-type POZ protein